MRICLKGALVAVLATAFAVISVDYVSRAVTGHGITLHRVSATLCRQGATR
jgi:hypothetical protein